MANNLSKYNIVYCRTLASWVEFLRATRIPALGERMTERERLEARAVWAVASSAQNSSSTYWALQRAGRIRRQTGGPLSRKWATSHDHRRCPARRHCPARRNRWHPAAAAVSTGLVLAGHSNPGLGWTPDRARATRRHWKSCWRAEVPRPDDGQQHVGISARPAGRAEAQQENRPLPEGGLGSVLRHLAGFHCQAVNLRESCWVVIISFLLPNQIKDSKSFWFCTLQKFNFIRIFIPFKRYVVWAWLVSVQIKKFFINHFCLSLETLFIYTFLWQQISINLKKKSHCSLTSLG